MAVGSFASASLRLRMTATFMVQGEPWLMLIDLPRDSWFLPAASAYRAVLMLRMTAAFMSAPAQDDSRFQGPG
ncbi:MAG: hypothetical protein B7Z74_10585 [Deltaproteobacteria bacterium 21-66-5]|nr:MAG: hypothetical protein B7Z74_10585 [Deltaproteobacteria bacterium 21-66-5]